MISNYNPKIDKSTVNKNKCNANKAERVTETHQTVGHHKKEPSGRMEWS